MDFAGFSVRDVTPSRPVFRAGYPSRRSRSDGVEDPLYLRIVAMADDKGALAAIVTADLLKFPKDMAWRIKCWAEQELALPSHSLIINLSHTHCAPGLFHQECYPHWGLDVAYVRELEAAIRDGLREAFGNLSPVRIRYGLHREHFGVSRRRPDHERPGKVVMAPNPEAYYDPDLPILTFCDPANGQMKALFYSYACHPTSKSGNWLSADYTGQLSQGLKAVLGDQVVTLFAQGAGASIMPRYGCKTEEERAAYAGHWRVVAEGIAAFAQSEAMRDIELELAGREHEFDIPYDMSRAHTDAELRHFADPNEPPITQYIRPGNREILRLWACGILEKKRTGALPTGFGMHVTRLQLSRGLQIIAMSGEVTADVGRLVKDAEEQEATIFLGYCSYTDAYIPTASMLPEDGHEATFSMYFHMRPAPFVAEIDDIIREQVAATRL